MEQQFAADTVYCVLVQKRNIIPSIQQYSSTQQVASLKKVIQGIVYKEVALD